VNSLTIGQQDNPKIAVVHLWHLHPAPEAAILLPVSRNERGQDPNDPGTQQLKYKWQSPQLQTSLTG
jgi:hypothetical protein